MSATGAKPRFDSALLEPEPGTRGRDAENRSLIYQCGSVRLDIMVFSGTHGLGALHGLVTDRHQGRPIAGARISVGERTCASDALGQFTVTLPGLGEARSFTVLTCEESLTFLIPGLKPTASNT